MYKKNISATGIFLTDDVWELNVCNDFINGQTGNLQHLIRSLLSAHLTDVMNKTSWLNSETDAEFVRNPRIPGALRLLEPSVLRLVTT